MLLYFKGVSPEELFTKFQDPHLFTAIMKSYLRELPQPLFGSGMVEEGQNLDFGDIALAFHQIINWAFLGDHDMATL